MEGYNEIASLSSLKKFNEVVQKITLWSKDNPIILNDEEKSFLLSCALILLKNYDSDKRYKSYAEFAYYIILKYSLITDDYTPLYDFSINFGFYPIAKSLVEKQKLKLNSIINYNVHAQMEDEYSYHGIIETYDQKKIRESILESKNNEVSYIAPTSYGKSSLIIDDIRKYLESRKFIAIIVPTKSLLLQTFRTVKKENFGRKIILHDEMYEKEDKFISVLTQERALRLLLKNPSLYFDALYIDEAHNLFTKDSRTILLSRLIRVNKKRNAKQNVMYLSPLISDSGNLKFDSEQDIFEHKIDFNIKEPEIYEFSIDTRIEKYNRFINKFYTLGKEENYLNYIQKTLKNKNFFFLMAPRKIEMFASDLYQNISNDIKNDNLIAEVIKSLKKYVHKDFYGIQYLEKGIVYLHGKVPDNIKEYLEFKFQTVPNIRFLVANNVILEGINLPIDNLYILSTHRLSSAKITNLIGRVNRLNMIFDSSNNDFSLLLPTVHFVNTTKYARKNSNMKGKIMQLRTGRFSDIIENPLLDKFDATKLEREDEPDSKQKKTFEKIIEEEKFVLDDNHTSDIHVLKRKMIELGMNTIYDLSDQICELLLSRIKSINSTIEKDFMSVIHKIFVEGLGNSIIDDEFARLKNEFIISHYEHFITSSKKKSLKENINYILSYFEKKKKIR